MVGSSFKNAVETKKFHAKIQSTLDGVAEDRRIKRNEGSLGFFRSFFGASWREACIEVHLTEASKKGAELGDFDYHGDDGLREIVAEFLDGRYELRKEIQEMIDEMCEEYEPEEDTELDESDEAEFNERVQHLLHKIKEAVERGTDLSSLDYRGYDQFGEQMDMAIHAIVQTIDPERLPLYGLGKHHIGSLSRHLDSIEGLSYRHKESIIEHAQDLEGGSLLNHVESLIAHAHQLDGIPAHHLEAILAHAETLSSHADTFHGREEHHKPSLIVDEREAALENS